MGFVEEIILDSSLDSKSFVFELQIEQNLIAKEQEVAILQY